MRIRAAWYGQVIWCQGLADLASALSNASTQRCTPSPQENPVLQAHQKQWAPGALHDTSNRCCCTLAVPARVTALLLALMQACAASPQLLAGVLVSLLTWQTSSTRPRLCGSFSASSTRPRTTPSLHAAHTAGRTACPPAPGCSSCCRGPSHASLAIAVHSLHATSHHITSGRCDNMAWLVVPGCCNCCGSAWIPSLHAAWRSWHWRACCHQRAYKSSVSGLACMHWVTHNHVSAASYNL